MPTHPAFYQPLLRYNLYGIQHCADALHKPFEKGQEHYTPGCMGRKLAAQKCKKAATIKLDQINSNTQHAGK